MKWFVRGSMMTLVLILTLVGCRNAFQVGLGEETDLEDPRVNLTSPDTGSFLTGTVTLRGTAEDDQEVVSVEISFDRGSTWTNVDSFDPESGEWSYEFDSTTRPDGRLFVTTRATDTAERTTTTDDTVYNIDNSPPVVLVSEPRGFESLTFNTDVVLTVNAADLHTIRKFGSVVELSRDDGETWEEIETTEVEQSTTWTKVFESRGDWTSDYPNLEPQAHFRFYLWAEDEAGNRSSSFYHIDDLNDLDSRPWTADTLLDELEGRGSLNEEDILAVGMPGNGDRQLELFFDENTDVPTIDWIAPVAAETGGIPGTRSKGLLAGIFRDDDGIQIDEAVTEIPTPRIEIRRAPDFSVEDYQDNPEGVTWEEQGYEDVWSVVEVESTSPELVASDITSVSWEYRLGEDLGQGYFRARLWVYDIDGTASERYAQVFVINDGSPSIEIERPENIYFNDNFVLEGSASAPADGDLEGVSVDIHDGASSDTNWALEGGNAVYTSDTQSWTYNTDDVDLPGLNDGSDLSVLADGNILVRAAAYTGDSSDARQVTLVKDTVAPEVGIDGPSAGSFLNTTAEVRGFSSDELSGIDTIEVMVDGSGAEEVLSDWTAFSETPELEADGYEFSGIATNWTLNIDTERFDDDTNLEVHVRARDRAGNTAETSRSYTVDQDSDLPTLAVSNMNVDGTKFENVLSGDPRLIGSVSDDDAVNPDSFRYRIWRTSESTWTDWLYVYDIDEEDPTPRLDFNIPLLDPDNDSQFLGDGSHQLQLWIEDVDGTGGIVTSLEDGTGLTRAEPPAAEPTASYPESPVSSEVLEFSVDKGAPTITIDSPPSSYITRENFDITGEATDGFGIETVEISFDGGESYTDSPLYSSAENGDDPETNVQFTYTVEVGETGDIDDGTYNIRMRAKDLSESEATENITVTIDTTPPTIDFIRPSDGATVNSEVLIQGSANDNIQVGGVYWYITPQGETAPANVETDWTEFANRYSWEYTWDSYAYQQTEQGNFDQAPYYFHTIAVDTAGNWSDIRTLQLTVDQESDRPTLDISNLDVDGSGMPDPIGTVPENVFAADALITGSVQDDDGITGSGITYRTRSWDWDADADAGAGAYGDWSAADSADWTPVEDTFTGERTNATWSQPVSFLGDGVHEIEFRVRDIHYDSERPLDVNFNWDTIGPVSFAINTANPQPAVTDGLAPTGTSFLNDNTPFGGTAADAVGIHEVGASFYFNDTPETVTDLSVSGDYIDGVFTWNTEFPVATGEQDQLAEGDYTVTVTATDRLGRTGSMSRAVYVDTEAPTITVENLAENDLITTADFTINGTADDGSGSGVAVIEYSLDGGEIWQDAAGTTRWSVALEGLEESLNNSIRLRSADQAGNESEPMTINFRVDTADPTITEVNLGTGTQYRNEDFAIEFTLGDTHGLARYTVTRDGTPLTGHDNEDISGDAEHNTTEVISLTENISELANDTYEYEISVTDVVEKTTTLNRTVMVDTESPDIAISNPSTDEIVEGTEYTIRGTATDNDGKGIETLEYSTDSTDGVDGTWTAITRAFNWSVSDVDFTAGGEGARTLWVRASDGLNEATAESVSFFYDIAPPELAETAVGSDEQQVTNEDVVFSGTASDSNELDRLEVSINGGAAIDVPVGADPEEADDTWSYTVSNTDNDGEYTLVFTAWDVAGRSTSLTRRVLMDTTPPEASIGELTANFYTNELPASGSAADVGETVSGIERVEYQIQTATGAFDAEGGWTEVTGTNSWFKTIDISALGEGEHTLYVRSIDRAGNVMTGELITNRARTFTIDRNNPVISVDAEYDGTVYRDDEFTITGTVSDTLALADEPIAIGVEGPAGAVALGGVGYELDYDSAATPDPTWSQAVPIAAGDGEYVVTITATDSVGRTSTVTRTVIVDTLPPTVEITRFTPVIIDDTDPENPVELVNNIIDFTIAAGDENGLSSGAVRWYMLRSDSPDPTYSDEFPTGNETGGTFSATPYSARIDTRDLDDNIDYTFWVLVRDRAGNETVISRDVKIDQNSDFPTVDFTDLDESIDSEAALQTALDGGDQDNLLELNARVRGVIEDDDRVDASSIQIAVNSADAFIDVTSPGSDGRSVSFSHTLGLDDDVHYFYLRFSDLQSAKIQKDGAPAVEAVTTTVGPVYFVIDTQNPELAITSPATNSYLGSDFTITGTASDASGIDRVEVSIDGGTNYSAASDTSAAEDPAYSTWSYNVTDEPDGVVTIQVRAFDAFDKTSSADRQINVDTEPPTVDIVEPIGGTTVNSTVRLRGSTFDNFTVDKSYYWIGEEGAAPPNVGTDLNEWTEFAGRYSWEYDWDTFAWQNTNQGNFDARNYTLHVIAQDSADNWSTVDSVTVTVDQESNKPIIEMTSIDAEAGADSNLLPVNLRINGAVEDDDAVDRLSIQVRVENLSDQSEVLGWTDISGPPDFSSAFVSWSHTFSADTGTALADGQYRLFVRAADINDGTYDQFTSSEIGPIEFAVDLANPTGSVIDPAQGAFINDDTFEITGTAADANGIKSVEILFDGEADPVAAVDTSGGDPAYSTWEYTFDASEAADGQISFQVIITDTYDKVTTVTRSFTLDRTPPTVSYIEPAAGAVVNGSLLVRGTSDDEFGVDSVSYALQRLSATADPVPAYPTDYTELTGTFSWDYRINTTDYDDGDYRIFIVAADQAGNANDDPDAVGPEDRPLTRDVTFDQSTNLPVITISNASDDDQNPTLFGSGGAILGTITDDDGVDHESIQIAFVENPQEDDWIAVTDPPSSGGVSVNFSHSLAGVAESADTYTVHVRASDIGEVHTAHTIDPVTSVSDPVYIGVDRNDPAVALATLDIVDPYGGSDRTDVPYSAGMLVNDDFTLRGTATDASGVVAVRVQIDGGDIDTATYSADTDTWSYVVPVTREATSDGPMTIEVEAEDSWGKTTTRTYNIVIDTTEPLVTFTEPDFGSNVNGIINLRGNNSDANSIISLLLQLGLDVEGDAAKTPVDLTNTGTLLSWEASVDTSDYANADRGVETPADSNVWHVPFVVTVEDAAGNRAEEERTLRVDPDSDKPIVAITGPDDGASVPTEFVFQGTITDDDPPPMSVQLAADSNDDGTFDVDLGEIAGIDSGSWVKIVDTTDTALFPTAPSGTMRLRAIPIDQNGTVGDADIHEVFVDTQAPIAGIGSPETGDIVRGEITITGTFRDDQALAESQMRVSFDGGNTFTAIGDVAGSSITPDPDNPVDGEYRYDFSIPVDTETQVDGGNGFLEIAVRVTDATFKQNTAFLDLSVDNTRPTMELNYDGTMEFFGSGEEIVYTFDGNETEGGNYIVIGSAQDEGTISGIERVDVYFVKSGEFLGVREGVDPLAVTTDSLYDQEGVEQTGVPYRVPEPRESDGVLVDDYVISIDNRFERGIYDQDPEFGDDDGFQESLRTIGAIDEWYAYIDTTVLPDGPFTLYAVVYDLAGNTSFIEAAAQAANYPPRISGVTVGTQDLGSDDTQAKVQGTVNLAIEATDTSDPFGNEGIDVSTFKLTVDSQYAVGSGGTIGAEQEGFASFFYGSQIGATADFDTRDPATGDAVTATAEKSIDTTTLDSGYWYRFVAEAEDTDGNLASRDFYVWINNEDDLPPVVTIDDFTQGSIGGLPGHLDLPDAANPALSGTVNITGTIYDDTSVEDLTLEISPDGGTSWYEFGTVTEFGDPIDGDVVTGFTYAWSYEWNTATIASVTGIAGPAQEDLIIRASGNDGTNITPIADRPQKDVDVVPYITNILTGFDAGLLAQARRSATGQYPVQVGQEITIVGYNMPGTVANSVSVGDTLLTPASADGTASVTVDLGVTDTSGELEVLTNEVASRNNTNDNAAPQNRESTQFNENLTDDRVIAFWDLRSHATLSNKEDAVMRSSTSAAGVDWLYTEGGNYLRYTDGALNGNAYMTDGFALRYGDFSYNDDGELLWVYLHNATWTALTEWGWYGSMQWGRSVIGTREAEETEAYNWNIPDRSRLGLGNMSFEGDANFTFNDHQLHRYRNPRIVTQGGNAATDNLVAYRDISTTARGLIFYGFQTGTGVAAGTALDNGWNANLSKTVERENPLAAAGNNNQQETGILTPTDRRGRITGDTATYFDLNVTPGGTAVAAWYDQGSGSLKFAYNESPMTTPDAWTELAQPITTEGGTHVTMEVDPDGAIHLAYLDTATGYLKYSYLPAYNTADGNIVSVFVDALFSSGQQNGITIRDFGAGDYRPVISTFSTTYSGTRGAVRAAWPETPLASLVNGADPATGNYTGDWEVMTVPAATPAQAESTFVEVVDPVGNNRITVGYNGEYLEEATYLGWD